VSDKLLAEERKKKKNNNNNNNNNMKWSKHNPPLFGKQEVGI
jgi:hypothetical protein